jgi:hypothetical protein
MSRRLSRSMLLMASALTLAASGGAALAQEPDSQLSSIEKQIKALQAELRQMKLQAAERDRELKAAQARAYTPPPTSLAPVMPQIPAGYALVPAGPGSTPGSVVLARAEAPKPGRTLPMGAFQVGAVTVQLGGFLDAATIFRSRNEVADITSSFTSGIPERNSQLYHEPEFRESARATRLSGTVTANPDEVTKTQAFIAIDFQGAAPTSNSNQSNSFIPRLREAWATYDRSDWGFELLGGQTWSLIGMTKQGMNPSQINLPIGIDAGYVAGFNYVRQPQIRFEKSFVDNTYWFGVSIENSQTLYANTSIPSYLGTLNISNPGIGTNGTGSNTSTTVCTGVTTTVKGTTATSTCTTTNVAGLGTFTNNLAPDIVIKATADYPMAHLEAYGLARVFNDRLSQDVPALGKGTGESNTLFGGGGGAAALVHVIPKMLDVQLSGLVGSGVGRYGASQLPDATIGSNGKPVSLPAYSALAGVIGHPDPAVDVYGYMGTEQVARRYFDYDGKAYGFGNPLYPNTTCNYELGSSADCTATTSGVVQGTVGAWYKFLKGPYGTMQVGAQYSYTRRFVFQGIGPTPKTDENMVFLDFRWYPFS